LIPQGEASFAAAAGGTTKMANSSHSGASIRRPIVDFAVG
jgi:hypothetical protein